MAGRPPKEDPQVIRKLYVETGLTPEVIAAQFYKDPEEQRRAARRVRILAKQNQWSQVAEGVRAASPEITQKIKEAIDVMRERFLIEYTWIMGQLQDLRSRYQRRAQENDDDKPSVDELATLLKLLKEAAAGMERLGVPLQPPAPAIIPLTPLAVPVDQPTVESGILGDIAAKQPGSQEESDRLTALYDQLQNFKLKPQELIGAPDGNGSHGSL